VNLPQEAIVDFFSCLKRPSPAGLLFMYWQSRAFSCVSCPSQQAKRRACCSHWSLALPTATISESLRAGYQDWCPNSAGKEQSLLQALVVSSCNCDHS
jgi:hypothetical protein